MKFVKTEVGQQAFKTRSTLMSARQRSAFILFDGVRSGDQVLAMTAGLGLTQDDIEHLLDLGFLAETAEVAAAPAASSASANTSGRTPAERYSAAMPIATQLTASLGLRGFRLNLAVEAASGYEDLLLLFPKIEAAVGVAACIPLERALNA